MKVVNVLLLGAGNRGMYAYGAYAKMNPAMMRIAAVAEPDSAKRRKMQEEHHISDALAFKTWEDAFDRFPDVDAVIIATQDKMHVEPLVRAMEKKKHILCEKPVVSLPGEIGIIEKAAAGFNGVFMTGYVLQYTPFFSRIKALIEGGRIGKLVGIDLVENTGHIHMSHSFVRGNWRNKNESSCMILAKSCHDMDMLAWLSGSSCASLSSSGKLNYFKAENAPEGAPPRCLDGCPHMGTCPYHVSKIYLTNDTGWPTNVISTDLSMEGRMKALDEGPYGRCVFHCDNDVVDHQTVLLHFANGVEASFTMSGFTMETHRSITVFGTEAEITGDMEDSRITIKDFSSRNYEEITVAEPAGGHSGGDIGLCTDFVRKIQTGKGGGLGSVRQCLESHYMAFAAEESRLKGAETLKMEEFKAGV
jgi:predicted dehydrogenase